MRADDHRGDDPLFHGAYLCLRLPGRRIGRLPLEAIAADLGPRNEFLPGDGAPTEIYGLIRRVTAVPGAIPDEPLMQTDALVHVASVDPDRVDAFVARVRG